METNVTSSSRDTKRGGKRGRDSIRREGLFDGHVHDGVLQKSKEGRRPSAPPKPVTDLFTVFCMTCIPFGGEGYGSGRSWPSGPAVGRDIQLSRTTQPIVVGCLRQPTTCLEPETPPTLKTGPGFKVHPQTIHIM